jgi:hypothetical protein
LKDDGSKPFAIIMLSTKGNRTRTLASNATSSESTALMGISVIKFQVGHGRGLGQEWRPDSLSRKARSG